MININNLVCESITVTTETPVPISHPETRVKYVGGATDTFNIEGELTSNSIHDIGNVEEVDIGDTVTDIGDYAFYYCTYLTDVVI